MATPRKLRAVMPGDEAELKLPLSIQEASAAGDTLGELMALRVLTAEMLSRPNIQGRDFAALSRRQLEIAREIEAMQMKARQEGAEDGDATPDEDWDTEAI